MIRDCFQKNVMIQIPSPQKKIWNRQFRAQKFFEGGVLNFFYMDIKI